MTVWARALRVAQWDRFVCHVIGTHELDWDTVHECGIRQCERCRRPMPHPVFPNTVGDLHPDSGD